MIEDEEVYSDDPEKNEIIKKAIDEAYEEVMADFVNNPELDAEVEKYCEWFETLTEEEQNEEIVKMREREEKEIEESMRELGLL